MMIYRSDYVTKKINKALEKVKEEPRDYLGASVLGSECWRQIWFEAKGTEAGNINSRTRRIFDIGKHLESLIIAWIKNANIDIFQPETPFVHPDLRWLQGNVDGIWRVKNRDHAIIEIKTANDAMFKVFKENGVKAWNVKYFSQLQTYMGLSRIDKAFFIVLNKNTGEIADELVLFEKEYYESLVEKAKIIYESVSMPPRINESPLWYQCKMCKFHKVCHNLNES